MADGLELVADFRRLANRFRSLISHNTPYRFEHLMGLREDGDLIFDKAWKGGFLRSIDGLEYWASLSELCCKDVGATLEYDLFNPVIGFAVDPKSMCDGLIKSGLLAQSPIEFRPITHPFHSMAEMLMSFKGGFEQLKPIVSYVADPSKWTDAMDRVSFDVCERCACGCEMVAEIIKREMAADNQADADHADDGDGLFENDRILVWGGVRFTLRTNQAIVFRLLFDAYPGDVTHGAFCDKGIGELRDSFRFNNAQRKKEYYPCWGLIADGSVKDSKRLIDPSIVRSDQEKFSDPQHNPQRSPG